MPNYATNNIHEVCDFTLAKVSGYLLSLLFAFNDTSRRELEGREQKNEVRCEGQREHGKVWAE